ncbi:myo-inosose-2 dehydratase [Mergibacter septicus]|uniref:myo-inosose-2 dehydratase n=1 Tax=Mergibacter septicus TaxID=221402 RepID=UPI001178DC40|nr:myo-inosose-2 dehydratase [Mergibacter septicus]AWX14557.1 myo-inosose-2 dehydratase [Mergibacter septicus]
MKAENIKLGIAPIGWTNDDLPELGKENTFEQCISEMALAGYQGCEVGNKYPRDIQLLKHQLDLRGIQICNAWFSTFFVDGKKQETIDAFIEHMNFLHQMGAKVIGCSEQSRSIQGLNKAILKEKTIFNDQEWRLLAAGYNELARIAAEKGMKVCLHHHMGTGIQTPEEIDRYMAEVNENVYLLFDSGHLYYSEGSQQAMLGVLEKYIDRIIHVHLKDVRDNIVAEVRDNNLSFLDGVKKGTFTVPGDGVIDFKPIFDLLDKHNYQGWIVVEAEQDPAIANPFEYAVKGRQYIKQVAGV